MSDHDLGTQMWCHSPYSNMEAVYHNRTKKIERSKCFSSPLVETLSRWLQQSREILTVGLRHHVLMLGLSVGRNHSFANTFQKGFIC